VDYAVQGVRVTAQSGQEGFDAVIVTVPLGVLKAGTIALAFPAWRGVQCEACRVCQWGETDRLKSRTPITLFTLWTGPAKT